MCRDAVFPYYIRWARRQEWAAAIALVWRTFLRFEGKGYTEEGIRNFYEFIHDDRLREAFFSGEYLMMVALDEDRIIGVASVRAHNHLSLLFVEEKYHRQGVGRALLTQMCSYLKNTAGERYVSLTAAPNAVNFYRKLGFHAVSAEEYDGIRVTSMEKYF